MPDAPRPLEESRAIYALLLSRLESLSLEFQLGGPASTSHGQENAPGVPIWGFPASEIVKARASIYPASILKGIAGISVLISVTAPMGSQTVTQADLGRQRARLRINACSFPLCTK